jgi:hypothetical protein
LLALDRLAALGMELAEALCRQALGQASRSLPAQSAGDPAASFERIARAVRQTLALAAKLDDDRRARQERYEANTAVRHAEVSQRAVLAKRERQQRQKLEVKRIIERLIEAAAKDAVEAENLLVDLDVRLEEEDDGKFGDRPVDEIVAGLCRELGIRPPGGATG